MNKIAEYLEGIGIIYQEQEKTKPDDKPFWFQLEKGIPATNGIRYRNISSARTAMEQAWATWATAQVQLQGAMRDRRGERVAAVERQTHEMAREWMTRRWE